MKTVTTAVAIVGGVAAALLFTWIAVADGSPLAVFLSFAFFLGVWFLSLRWQQLSRRAAVKLEARRLGSSFSARDPFRILDLEFHPFVRFADLPGSQRVENVAWGERGGRQVRVFDYWRKSGDDAVRLSCAIVPIPSRWSPLLIRRRGRFDLARAPLPISDVEFELEAFNRAFEVRATDRAFATAVVDQRMMEWLLSPGPVQGFQLQRGWLFMWMSMVEPDELERAMITVGAFHDRIPRAVWSLYGEDRPARTDIE
jgi:hypothetical protein